LVGLIQDTLDGLLEVTPIVKARNNNTHENMCHTGQLSRPFCLCFGILLYFSSYLFYDLYILFRFAYQFLSFIWFVISINCLYGLALF
jgi:hypothetical protein